MSTSPSVGDDGDGLPSVDIDTEREMMQGTSHHVIPVKAQPGEHWCLSVNGPSCEVRDLTVLLRRPSPSESAYSVLQFFCRRFRPLNCHSSLSLFN